MRAYLPVLRRHGPLIGVATIVTVGVALAASFARAPLYKGRVEVVVQAPASTLAVAPGHHGPFLDSSRLVPTEIRVLTSQEVSARASRTLGFSTTVTARQVGQTDVMEVTATAATRERAQAAAQQYAAAYVDFRRTAAARDLRSSSGEVEAELRGLEQRIDISAGAERSALENQYALFAHVQAQLQVDAAGSLDRARLVSPTSGGSTRVGPGVATVAVWAAVVGLVLGVDSALLFHVLDETVTNRADLRRASGGLAVLGAIPESREATTLASTRSRGSPTAEGYRALQAVLLAAGRTPPIRTLQITSPGPGEGKTTTVANLGLALAEAGRDVVLVDADLRRPALHERFGLANDIGLTSVVVGSVPVSAALQPVPGQARLRVLASGILILTPGQLMSSRRVVAIFESLRHMADVVIIDTPPVLSAADALVVSRLVDSTVVVASSGRTKRRDVARALEELRKVEAPVVGLVLNGGERDLDPVLPGAPIRA